MTRETLGKITYTALAIAVTLTLAILFAAEIAGAQTTSTQGTVHRDAYGQKIGRTTTTFQPRYEPTTSSSRHRSAFGRLLGRSDTDRWTGVTTHRDAYGRKLGTSTPLYQRSYQRRPTLTQKTGAWFRTFFKLPTPLPNRRQP